MRDLFFVAVEQERRLLDDKESGADHALAFLTPPRMIDVGIHIRVKSVLVRRKLIPEALWLLVHKLDLRQRFRAFESVLPWNNQNGAPLRLVAERFAVKADCDKRQLVRRLRQSEAFRVRPRKIIDALCRTIGRIEKRNKFHILRFGFWLRKIDKLRQRKTVPRNHH